MRAFHILLISNGVLSYNLWCGYQPSWRLYEEPKDDDYGYYGEPGQLVPSNDKRLTFIDPQLGDFTGYNKLNMSSSLNLKTGIFNSPKKDTYIVTLTALLAPIDDNRLQSYSQMFILKNGELTSKNHYLLVKGREVADLREEIPLDKGDTLEVLVGHHVNNVNNFGPSGSVSRHDGFHLEQIRFCVF